jgi:hypothetical protein
MAKKPIGNPLEQAIVSGTIGKKSEPIEEQAAEPPDFSVVLLRPHFMLASKEYPMKSLTNQQLWTMPYPPEGLAGAALKGQTRAPEGQKP